MINQNQIDLGGYAQRINAKHHAAEQTAHQALEYAKESGELLLEAKGKVAHGQWLSWIDTNLHIGPRQAQKYMKLAKNLEGLPKTNLDSYLTVEQAVKAISHKQKYLPPDNKQAAAVYQHGNEMRVALIQHSQKYPGYYDYGMMIMPKDQEDGLYEYGIKPIRGDAIEFVINKWGLPENIEWTNQPRNTFHMGVPTNE